MPERQKIPWWAEENWWEDAKVVGWLGCDLNSLQIAAECMKQYFDRSWWAEFLDRRHPHVVGQALLGRGSMPAGFILSLGSQLRRLKGCDGLATKIDDLREGNKARGVLFEVHVADTLFQSGFKVAFPREQEGKTPDIMANRDDGAVAVECKRLGESDVDRWTSGLMDLAAFQLPSIGAYEVEIELVHDLTFLRMDKRPGWNDALLNAIDWQIRSQVLAALRQQEPPSQINVDGIASISLRPGTSGMGSVSGGPRWPAAELRRVLEYVFKSCGKFPADTPGVLAFSCDFAPGVALLAAAPDAVERVALPDELVERLGGIVVIPSMSIGPGSAPVASMSSKHTSNPVLRELLNVLTLPRSRAARVGCIQTDTGSAQDAGGVGGPPSAPQ